MEKSEKVERRKKIVEEEKEGMKMKDKMMKEIEIYKGERRREEYIDVNEEKEEEIKEK